MDKNKYIETECCECQTTFKTTTRNKLRLCPRHYLRYWYDRRNYLRRVRRKLKGQRNDS